MSSYLNINKLHEELEQRRIKKYIIYDTVLDSITKRIQYTNSTNDNCYLFYPVPGFISGMPIRDRPACMQYVMSKLAEMGFVTRFVQPNYIYVSWRHAKNKPVDPSYISDSQLYGVGSPVHAGHINASDMGYRIPDTGTISQSSRPHTNAHLMSFTDQVRANRNPVKSKMLEFESIDEQFLAGNEHYNPNFKPGSIYNSNQPLPIKDDNIGVPSHIMRAHRPYLDPTNPRQPEPSISPSIYASAQSSSYLPTQQPPPQIKSVSITPEGCRRNSGRKPRNNNGPVNLDDLLSPKPTSSCRVNSIGPISPATPQQLANDNNRINQVLAQFGSQNNNNNNKGPNGGVPNDIMGTLL